MVGGMVWSDLPHFRVGSRATSALGVSPYISAFLPLGTKTIQRLAGAGYKSRGGTAG